jgi:hypothetical protein
MSGDYEVGYGKPPVQAQFKKGLSANPGGKPGPKRARRQRFARMLDGMLLQPTEIIAMTPCKTAFAAMARRMVLDVARAKPAAVRQAFALLDELEPRRPGQRRPRGIDQKLEDAEWADQDATWCDSEQDADSPVSERIIEERLQSWSEIAQQHFRAEKRSDRLSDRAVEAAASCGSARDAASPVSEGIIEERLQRR